MDSRRREPVVSGLLIGDKKRAAPSNYFYVRQPVIFFYNNNQMKRILVWRKHICILFYYWGHKNSFMFAGAKSRSSLVNFQNVNVCYLLNSVYKNLKMAGAIGVCLICTTVPHMLIFNFKQDKIFRRKRLSTGANFVHVYIEIWVKGILKFNKLSL